MKKIGALLLGCVLLLPAFAHAWWNADWSSRKKIVLDTSDSGAATHEALNQVAVLMRLHTGNFGFADAKEDGSDLRFIGGDDKTPLKYHVEKFDPINELALIWVQIPKLSPATKSEYIWLYYGNQKAVAAEYAKGSYDASHLAVFHFGEKDGMPKDITGYANNASRFSATRNPGSLIGTGLKFDGKEEMALTASPSLKLSAAGGFTFSAWIKIATSQQGAVLFAQQEGAKSIKIAIDQTKIYASLNAGSGVVETPKTADVAVGAWHHIAVTAGKRLTVYVDGKEAAAADVAMPDLQGDVTLGKSFAGELDELDLSNAARSSDWIMVAAKGQGPEAKLVSYGEGEVNSSSESTSHFGTILHSVTLDGWVVIGILVVMAAISWMVMLGKALVISKTERVNKEFLSAFHELRATETAALDQDDDGEDADIEDSPLMSVLVGKHDHYQNSPLYRVYHAGTQELKRRFGVKTAAQTLSPQAIDVIKATLDATMVRENQKLNSLMVLLTIAISGGPFLGLLGTVVGVMITFAAIAATGDVNVAAIAPGIAAALVATVAGLAVAIPALFGYNYLGSKIKNITADMYVFSDEYITRVAESYSK